MIFLTVNYDSTANIYGHTYNLRSSNNPLADLQDILVADNGSASELLERHNGILATANFAYDEINGFPKLLDKLEDVSKNSKILLLRSGGIGDHIMLLPALAGLKKAVSDLNIELWLSVQEDMFPIFKYESSIDRLLPLPLPMTNLMEADYYMDFSGHLDEAVNPNQHLTDYFLKKLGINPLSLQIDDVRLPMDIICSKNIINLFDRLRRMNPNSQIVLLNWFASTHIKSLPPSIHSSLSKEFKDTIFIVSHPESSNYETERDIVNCNIKAINISFHMKSLYDYFTAISLSDAVVCSDTSTYHIASFYGKPSLVIIGPTYSILTKYYPQCSFVEAHYRGDLCASPCGRTKGMCPESKQLGTPYSPCLMSISENSV